ncbi:hypothetical protein JTE90_029342 [Oedothorax gibbosus]|uniref:Uncharacterized protein n=1 Tax=Oedothorax gibbosus TaxID=931172 RepID=A0AAV6UHG4_9ARAC|nr:hypothetical protein JTE90_029342 [Oedothorax gibbosus]
MRSSPFFVPLSPSSKAHKAVLAPRYGHNDFGPTMTLPRVTLTTPANAPSVDHNLVLWSSLSRGDKLAATLYVKPVSAKSVRVSDSKPPVRPRQVFSQIKSFHLKAAVSVNAVEPEKICFVRSLMELLEEFVGLSLRMAIFGCLN